MPNTYSQLSIHCVFAVKYRESLIEKNWRDELHKYISGILTANKATSLAVGGWLDHIHIFFGLPVTTNISALMDIVKAGSSKWVNERNFTKHIFRWQSGYGAFSHSKSERDTVIRYIMNQEKHHMTQTFRSEYMKMLTDFDVQYDEKYLFEFFD